MKKNDFVLMAGFAAAALMLWLAFLFFRGTAPESLRVSVRVDGRETAGWPLLSDTDEEIVTAYGRNRVLVSHGRVTVTEADCPDGLCMKQHSIGTEGGSIVCLPHHLVISVEAAQKDDKHREADSRDPAVPDTFTY